MCATVNAIKDAGSRNTCAAYQRINVSAPRPVPPFSNPLTKLPTSGVLRAMFSVTVVAQYAF